MKLKDYLFAIISGFILLLAFPSSVNLNLSGSMGFFAFFGLAPLLIVLKDKNSKQAFSLGLITGFIYLGGAVFWLNNMKELGVLAFPCWLLLGLYLAFFTGLFALLTARAGLVFAPFIWIGLELLRTLLFTGFPWALLGYSQFTNLPLIQICEFTGVYGISFLAVLINTGLALATANKDAEAERVRKYLPLAAGVFLLCAVLFYGSLRLKQLGNGTKEKHIFTVVQANVAQPEKWEPAYSENAFSKHEKLSESAKDISPEVLVWPETATAMYVKYKPEYLYRLSRLAKNTKADLLIGTPDAVPDRDLNIAEAYNSVLHLSNEGKPQDTYAKIHLVPFGEFMPLEKQLKFLEKFTSGFNKWNAGKEPVVFTTAKGLKISSPVCWEVIFPDDCRRFVEKGARYFLTVSNDGWYGVSAAPYQHFMVLPFRAVENRISIGRAANTVLSGFVDYTGKIITTLGQNEMNTLSASLNDSGQGLTFYTLYGDIFSWACVLPALFGIITGYRFRKGNNG